MMKKEEKEEGGISWVDFEGEEQLRSLESALKGFSRDQYPNSNPTSPTKS